jgi:hypothetical protein
MIGVGPDLAPHYRIAFRHWRANHPGTPVGEPGPMQGFNTGVVLYDFDRMRDSVRYNEYVDNLMNRDRFLKNPFLAGNFFKINFQPQILYKFPPKNHGINFYEYYGQ